MFDSLLASTPIPLLEKAAVFGERRQAVLAGNVANIDTPGYAMRDLPTAQFQEALRDAVDAKRNAAAFRSPGFASAGGNDVDLEAFFPRQLFEATKAASTNIRFQDGNNRSIEAEMMTMTKNILMQNYAIELMTTQLRMLETAISGHV